MIILDGKKFRDELLEKYKTVIKEKNLKLQLDIILIGYDEASQIYVKNKIKFCNLVGIKTELHELKNPSEDEVLNLINNLNNSASTTGIILQSPTPNLDFNFLSNQINSKKDVDGLVKENIFNLYNNKEQILPCTVKGILKLLEHYNIPIKGQNITLIGRGEIVGKPLSLALQNRGATVTTCTELTRDLSYHTKKADIIISAVGKKDLIKEDMVSDGFVGIDVGIVRENEKIYGDFDYENTKNKASYLTPVPGGIGPMTIAMIIENLIEMSEKNG